MGQTGGPPAGRPVPPVVLISVLLGVASLLTTIDPIQLTEYSLVFSAVVLPLTYLPILVVANDRAYLGDKVNGPLGEHPGHDLPGHHPGRRARRDPADDPDRSGAMNDQPDPLRVDFHLLDRQIVDIDGEPVGKVDDVELTLDPATGRLRVTALLSGQQVLGERIGGRVGGSLPGSPAGCTRWKTRHRCGSTSLRWQRSVPRSP